MLCDTAGRGRDVTPPAYAEKAKSRRRGQPRERLPGIGTPYPNLERTVLPTEEEIDQVLEACVETEASGESKYPGMTYEQGVDAAIRWMQGGGDHPMDE